MGILGTQQGLRRINMMRNLNWKEVQPGSFNRLLLPLFAVAVVLGTGGCGSGDGGGKDITTQTLPTSLSLRLECDEVGIYTPNARPCILDDRNNPYATVNIIEFDPQDEDADNKFDLANEIPDGPEYAISRFYFWATALARRGSGENQYYTALALHELWSEGVDNGSGSRNAQEQAKKAYRACLDYFFDDFTFIGPFPDLNDPDGDFIPLVIRGLVGTLLVSPEFPLKTLFPSDNPPLTELEASELAAKTELGEWGYFYVPPGPGDPFDPATIPADIIRNNNLPIPPQLD